MLTQMMISQMGLAPENFLLASHAGCQVGMGIIPENGRLIRCMGSLVLPNTPAPKTQLSKYATRYGYPPSPLVRSVILEQSPNLLPLLITPEAIYDQPAKIKAAAMHSTTAALAFSKAANRRSVLFELPPGIAIDHKHSVLTETEAVEALITGLRIFLERFNQGIVNDVFVRIRDQQSLISAYRMIQDWQIQHTPELARTVPIEDEDDIQQQVLDFLASRSQHEEALPRFIPPYNVLSPEPISIQRRRMQSQSDIIAPLHNPQQGEVRLITTQILDKAFSLLPACMQTVAENCPPLTMYARYSFKYDGSIAEDIEYYTAISYNMFSVGHPQLGDFAIGELSLLDIPHDNLSSPEDLTEAVFISQIPQLILTRILDNGIPVAKDIATAIKNGCNVINEIVLTEEEIDKMLVAWVLHEFAEMLWYTLPEELKQEWIEIFPIEPFRTESDFAYFRNLLRMATDHTVNPEEKQDFFAKETFADKLSIFWNPDLPLVFKQQGTKTSDREKAFFEKVMRLIEQRRQNKGSAFYLG